jgi:tetratricopeptide (TPR) repeat protein
MQITTIPPAPRLIRTLAAAALLLMVPWTAQGAEPQPPPDRPDRNEANDQQIQQLIQQLGDQEYYVRERAQTELAKFGFEAFDALSAAKENEDLEIAARARYLLRLMRVEWTGKNDPPEVRRLLADYEVQNMVSKLGRMRALADLPDAAALPALCRLVRYEKSTVLSKHAAIQVINSRTSDGPPTKEQGESVRKGLARSNRAAAKWLLTWTRFADDPQAAVVDWAKLVDEEQARLQSAPSETSAEIAAALVRLQIGWHRKLNQTDRAVAAMRRLIDLEQGNPETLRELVDWLVQQRAWKVIEELADKFTAQFNENAVLLYTLAQAYAAQGDQSRAEKAAQRAERLSPGNTTQELVPHLITAFQLRQRGLFTWAEREYRHVIASGAAEYSLVATAHFGLSEMLHDQGQDLPAAELLQAVVAAVEKHQPVEEEVAGRATGEIRSRMHYFFACHFRSAKDAAREHEHLDKALAGEEVDIDALIACYRLPGPPAEQREKVRTWIKKLASDLAEEIGEQPKNPSAYNQYAWLIGNTEGDLDLALKYSKKSLDLSPDNGGFYDTLAHVYFAKGDYENAVKTQIRAAALDPHSGLILRQLKVFREKLDQQKQQPKPKEPAN